MKIKLETVTPEIARELLKANTRNRRVRSAHVDFLASEMVNGRWKVTSETIAIDPQGIIVDGQHRLLAVAQSGTPIEFWVARDVPLDTQDVIDFGSQRSVADQLHLGDGIANANLMVGALRTITSICCYYQSVKLSTDAARLVYSEFGNDVEFVIENTRNFRPGFKTWVIGSLALAYSADRSAGPFIEAFGSGEGLLRGNPAKAARDWLVNARKNGSELIAHSYKKSAIEGLLNAAYNHVTGDQISTIRRGTQGVDYFTGKRRKAVAMIREQMKQQLSVAA